MTDIELTRQSLMTEGRAYSRRRDVNPYVALLDEVKWRAGHVAALRAALARLEESTNLLIIAENRSIFALSSQGDVVDGPLLRRYDKERTLLDRACKLAIDAGVAERYVQLAELQGGVLFRVLETTFNDPQLALTANQRNQLGPALERAFEAHQASVTQLGDGS